MKLLHYLPRLLVLLGAFAWMSTSAAVKGPKPLVVANGEVINLADYLVAGKTTVVDFTSQFCPPCRSYDEPLNQLHARRADLAVVKVNINRPGLQKIDWKSPVAQQFKLGSLPHFKIYGPDGKLIAEGWKASRKVDKWLE